MPARRTPALAILASGLIALTGNLHGQPPAPDVIAVLRGHTDTVEAVALSPDGARIATACFDRSVRLFDAATGKEIRAYGGEKGHRGQVLSVVFSPRGDRLATGGADNFARVWEVPVDFPAQQIALASAGTGAAAAADGKTFAVAGADGTVKIFPNGEDKGAIELKGTTGAVTHLGSSGKNWVAIGADRTMRYWGPDGKATAAVSLGTAEATGLAVGQSLYTTTNDGVLRQWQPAPQSTRAFPPLKDAVTAFAATADGNTILTASADKLVTLGTVPNNKAVATFTGAKAAIAAVALSADGATSAAGCADGSVIFWDRQGKQKGELAAHGGGTTALAFHPSQPVLFTAGGDGLVKAWSIPIDPKQPKEKAVKHTIKAHIGKVTALVVHPSSGQVVTAGADKRVCIWDPVKPEKPVREIGPAATAVGVLALSRDGTVLAGAAGKDLVLWNLSDGKEAGRFAQPAELFALSFNGDRTRILAGRADNLAALIDVKDGTVVQWFAHTGAVRGVLAHPATPAVITASADRTVMVAPIAVQRATPLGGKPVDVVLSPDSQRVITVGPGKSCTGWNAGNGQKEREYAAGGDALAAAFTKDGQRLAVAGADGSIKIYTTGDGKLAGSFAAGGPVSRLAFHPKEANLVGLRASGAVVWNVGQPPGQPVPAEFGRAIQSFPLPNGAASLVFLADGRFLTASADKQLRWFRIAADTPVQNLQHPNLVDCVAFDKTGASLATGCHDGVLRIWDTAKGAATKTIPAHVQTMPQQQANPIYAVLWSQDDKQIFTSSYDRTVKLWDVASGKLVREFPAAPDPKPIEPKKEDPKAGDKKEAKKEEPKKVEPAGLPGHRDQVFALALTQDGKFLATGSSDRTLKLWDVATGRVVREFPNPDLKPVLLGETAPSHPGWVQSVRLSPDGQYLITAGPAPRGKSYLAVWKLADGTRVHGAERDFGPIHSLAISRDGTKLVIGCAPTRGQTDGAALIIKLPVK